MTDMVGKILHNRYKILRPVGVGGMAEVYLAQDMLLDREVAVKILRAQFNNDKSQLEQFRREAQSAARLIHPSIVNIFDVCEENSLYFIVMEYVDGRTLKSILEEQGPLKPFWAVHIACELAAALQHAHNRNIIHCDIKPHNVLINKSMTPKIADFGIARMVTSQTMVYTSSVIGSVHYLSPEQAGGCPVTAQSDIYSLGIVLYEMLTGHVPFDGKTAVAVAMMHLEKTPPPLKTYDPDLPDSLQEVIDKALAKDPADRYATAEEMWQDLYNIKTKMLQESVEEDYAEMLGITAISKNELAEPTGKIYDWANDNEEGAPEETIIMKPAFNKSTDEIVQEAAAINRRERRNKYIKLFALVAILSAVFLMVGNVFSRKTVDVPNVVGKSVVEAQKTLEKSGFTVKLDEEYDEKVTPGYVIKQEPEGISKRKEGSEITLVVSKGLEMLEMPDLIGRKLDNAKKFLSDLGYETGVVTYKFVAGKPADSVLEQAPKAKNKTPKGSKVDLVVCRDPKDLSMPDVMGSSLNDAKKALTELGIMDITVRYVESGSSEGSIVGMEPPAGSKFAADGKVVLQVSSGSHPQSVNKYAEFVVPQGSGTQDVQIILIDANGQRTVYQGAQKAGVRIRQKVEVTGSGKVQFFCNNKMVEEKNL